MNLPEAIDHAAAYIALAAVIIAFILKGDQ